MGGRGQQQQRLQRQRQAAAASSSSKQQRRHRFAVQAAHLQGLSCSAVPDADALLCLEHRAENGLRDAAGGHGALDRARCRVAPAPIHPVESAEVVAHVKQAFAAAIEGVALDEAGTAHGEAEEERIGVERDDVADAVEVVDARKIENDHLASQGAGAGSGGSWEDVRTRLLRDTVPLNRPSSDVWMRVSIAQTTKRIV